MTPARTLAHQVLLRVLRDGAYADRTLTAALARAELETRERAFATELVYGTLRHVLRLDYILGKLSSRPLGRISLPTLCALRLGAYQVLETRVATHSAVNESVALARRDHAHHAGFVNAILRELVRRRDESRLPDPARELADPLEALAITSSHPLWYLRDLARDLPVAELEALVQADNEVAPLGLRVTGEHSRDEAAALLRERGLDPILPEVPSQALLVRHAGAPQDLPGFLEGRLTVQDPAAQLVALLAAPPVGGLVLDACAAPGGKTAQLAERVGPSGRVVAVEVHPGRMRLVNDQAQRLGLKNITAVAGDATALPVLNAALASQLVDVALVDAPCSGMGTLRKNHELRLRDAASVPPLVALQDKLLDACAQTVRPGGALVYAVCTLTRAEGPERLQAFLERHPNFVLEAPPVALAAFCERTADLPAPYLRTFPHRHAMDGFFAARLRRKDP